jgi:hypothetical protein
MRKLAVALLIVLIAFGCAKKDSVDQEPSEETKANEQAAEEVGIPASDAESAPKTGFDALKDIKEIRNEEHERQKEEKEIADTIENQQ